MVAALREQLTNVYRWPAYAVNVTLREGLDPFVLIWNDPSKPSEPQELHCDGKTNQGQALLYGE